MRRKTSLTGGKGSSRVITQLAIKPAWNPLAASHSHSPGAVLPFCPLATVSWQEPHCSGRGVLSPRRAGCETGCPTCHRLYADSPGWAPGWCWWVSDYLGSPGGPQCQPPPPPPRSGAPRACSTPGGLGTPAGDRSEAEKRELCGGEGSPGPGGQQV